MKASTRLPKVPPTLHPHSSTTQTESPLTGSYEGLCWLLTCLVFALSPAENQSAYLLAPELKRVLGLKDDLRRSFELAGIAANELARFPIRVFRLTKMRWSYGRIRS